jgi:hypothetical protein
MTRRARIDPQALREQLSLGDAADPRSPHFLRFVIRFSEALDLDIPHDEHPRLASLAGCMDYVRALEPEPR